MEDNNLAYFAGILDGEGTIGIFKTKYKTKKYGIRESRFSQVTFTNTDENLIKWAKDKFGGVYRERKDKSQINRKRIFVWQISQRKSLKLLENLLPYLIVKKEKANIVINYLKNKNPLM